MSTQTNRPNADEPAGPGRPRRVVTPRLEAMEPRFLLATGASSDPEIAFPPALTAAPIAEVAPPDADPTAPAAAPDPAGLAAAPAVTFVQIDFDDEVVSGDAPKQYQVTVGNSDTLEFGLIKKPESRDFLATVEVYSVAGDLITSGPLASSTDANGSNRVTIVGIPRGDAGSRPNLIRVAIPLAGSGDTAQPYHLDLNIEMRSDPGDSHVPFDPTNAQPTPSADGQGGWYVDMSASAPSPPSPANPTSGPHSSPSIQPQAPASAGSSTMPQVGPRDGFDTPDPDATLESSAPTPTQSTRSSGGEATTPGHADALPSGSSHRPPPVDLVTPDPESLGRDGVIPLLADAAAESGGLIPVAWLAQVDPPAHSPGPGLFASPLDWLDGAEGEAFLSWAGEGASSQRIASLGGDEASADRTGSVTGSATSRDGSSANRGSPGERDPANLESGESKGSCGLMPILAGLGGSSALFAGLLLPDLANLFRPFLLARRRLPPPAKRRRG